MKVLHVLAVLLAVLPLSNSSTSGVKGGKQGKKEKKVASSSKSKDGQKEKRERKAASSKTSKDGKNGYKEKKVYYIYLSGPEVFLASPFAAGDISKAKCEEANDPDADFSLQALYPLDSVIEDFAYDLDTALRIYSANVDLMDRSFATASNMIRFRGPSMDVGTAFEMGYVRAQGKPVFAYYDAIPFYGAFEKSGLYAARVLDYNFTKTVEDRYDKDDLEVEGFGGSDNLMMYGSYIDSGYEQSENVYESCLDAVDYIKNNF